MTGPLIRPIRTSTLSGASVHLERQPFNITLEQSVCHTTCTDSIVGMASLCVFVCSNCLFYLAIGHAIPIPHAVSAPPIHLGRAPLDECSGVELMCQQCDPFPSEKFTVREDATFVAVIGPAANPRGYTAITGQYVDTTPLTNFSQLQLILVQPQVHVTVLYCLPRAVFPYLRINFQTDTIIISL